MSADEPTAQGEPELDTLSGGELELADLLNTVLDKGVVLHGDVTLAVADVDLVKLNLGLLLSALETVERAHPSDDRPTLANLFGSPAFTRSGGVATEPQVLPNRSSVFIESPSAGAENTSNRASLNTVAHGLPERINADAPGVESGLARLVLTLIEVLRKVLEHQAVRRMDGGKLSQGEIERLGLALSRLNDKMDELKRVFGLSDEDLQIDLGPLGHLR